MGTDADALESLSKARLQPRAHPLFFSRPGRRVCGAQDERVSARSRTLNDVPGVAEYVRGTLASFAADKMFKAAGKRCLELQDFLSKELPPEIHHKMLPHQLRLGRGRRAGASRGTAPQHHGHGARP